MVKGKIEGKTRRVVLSIGIAVLYVMFIAYAIETFYPSPNYENFCPYTEERMNYNSELECTENNGKWTKYSEGSYPKPADGNGTITGYCDYDYYCREEYSSYQETYNRNIFFLTLIIGIITFVVAVALLVESVSAGFMGGGVLLIIYGTLRYWGSLSDIWRTIMLGFALAVLVWIGYKKLN